MYSKNRCWRIVDCFGHETRLIGSFEACESSARCMTEHMKKAGIKMYYNVLISHVKKDDVVLPTKR